MVYKFEFEWDKILIGFNQNSAFSCRDFYKITNETWIIDIVQSRKSSLALSFIFLSFANSTVVVITIIVCFGKFGATLY